MTRAIIPVYSSRGDADAFLVFPYLFNRAGEWIGFVTPQREVFSILGFYVGFLTNDPRIIRKRTGDDKPRIKPPSPPASIRISATIPLPKSMSDLPPGMIDVLQDEPDKLHTQDAGELRPDMD